LSANSVKRIFTTHIIGNYNPLTTLSFAVEYNFFGANPKIYHVDNLILHLLCIILVFWMILLMGAKPLTAFIVGLLFGIHPLRIESVVWITERKDVLYSAFYLSSLVAYVLFVRRQKKRYYFLSLLLFIPSLLSKIQAVTLPLACLVLDYYLNRPLKIRLVLEKIPFFILSLVTGLIGIHFLRQMGSMEINEVFPLFQRFFIGTYSLSVYILKSLVPFQMSAIYPYPRPIPLIYYLSPIFLIVATYFIIRSTRYTKDVVFGSLFFFVNIIFLLQVVGAGQGFIADRFSYIAYIGLFFIYAKTFDYIATKLTRIKPLLYTVGAVYMIAMVIISLTHIKVWKNTETLFTDVLQKHPGVPVAYNNRGRYYRTLNKFDKALEDYNKAITLNPKGYAAYNNRGKVYFETNENEKAITDYSKALEINPKYVDAYANRGGVYGRTGRYAESIEDLNKAIELDSMYINAYSNRALTFYYSQQYEPCIWDCSFFLRFYPLNADMYNLRGLANNMLKRNQEAITDYSEAIRLKPGQGIFYQNRSYAYFTSGDMKKALEDAEKAQDLGVTMDPAYLRRLK
jgi:tetratricopeptide (TPR) repeat protein